MSLVTQTVYLDIYINQGSSYNSAITLTNVNQTPYNFLGSNVFSSLKTSYATNKISANFTSYIDNVNGTIYISLPWQTTANIKYGNYVYDVILQDQNNNVYRIQQGNAYVEPGISLLFIDDTTTSNGDRILYNKNQNPLELSPIYDPVKYVGQYNNVIVGILGNFLLGSNAISYSTSTTLNYTSNIITVDEYTAISQTSNESLQLSQTTANSIATLMTLAQSITGQIAALSANINNANNQFVLG